MIWLDVYWYTYRVWLRVFTYWSQFFIHFVYYLFKFFCTICVPHTCTVGLLIKEPTFLNIRWSPGQVYMQGTGLVTKMTPKYRQPDYFVDTECSFRFMTQPVLFLKPPVWRLLSVDGQIWCRLWLLIFVLFITSSPISFVYRQAFNLRRSRSQSQMYLVSSCSCLCPIQWSRVLSREWRYSWSIANFAVWPAWTYSESSLTSQWW